MNYSLRLEYKTNNKYSSNNFDVLYNKTRTLTDIVSSSGICNVIFPTITAELLGLCFTT